ncbi:PspA/IM30 family protein [Candidatus Atelocyanobacterium thalassae]|uniref:Phage shock protein A (IM30), suppresses sigma54-dependent transcription n=1 Tax=Atelocyanobacterium thalassa (isolate ALOHA) TaxID=1453429 RepID=D3ENI2_ATETH|nr:PspA/IM30 family protein [Candidatus Atelocyanobacterium thalassa]ADB95032.1 phage shock protein A (IM30), suppresses sigma54-dependent transcription [Candidatus Atelocyanobacterium thalassa isolate ALOHA]MCH2543473.1 PspA/IM30 family protein [Candidatus Atelocyanobacterium sp. ALOHA_A2.5_9]|tara:strand:+ start:130178 stop:130954 length:777 start_codon:yes stop_codon:yes gene_type:complete
MGLFDRLSRVVRANLNDLVSRAEDPEKVLEQTLVDMSEDLVQLKQAFAQSLSSQKRIESQYKKSLMEANNWEQRAKLAISRKEEDLAREALVRKKSYSETALTLNEQLNQQNAQLETMRQNLATLESKIGEAKTKKNILIARSKAAKATQSLQKTMSGLDTSTSMSAFERMESKVLDMEAQSQSVGELAAAGVEGQFAQLEASSEVDEELAMLKTQISGSSTPQGILPESTEDSDFSSKDQITDDEELEKLKRELNNM